MTFYGTLSNSAVSFFLRHTQTPAKTGYTTISPVMRARSAECVEIEQGKKKSEREGKNRTGGKQNSDSRVPRASCSNGYNSAIGGVPRGMDTNGFSRWK